MKKCWMCDADFAADWPRDGEGYNVDCRTCGKYWISVMLAATPLPLPDEERYRLSYWNRQRTLDRRDPVELSRPVIEAIVAQLPNPRPSQKPDLLLVSLVELQPFAGHVGPLTDLWRDRSLGCARDPKEFEFLLRALLICACTGPPSDLDMSGRLERPHAF